MRKWLLWMLLCTCCCSLAHADDVQLVQPGPDDLSQAEAKAYAVDFFAGKCDLPPVTLDEGEWTMNFGYFQGTDAPPQWKITVRYMPGHHASGHHLTLSAEGELLSWIAHGPEYTVETPELLDGTTPADPLPTDVTEAEVRRILTAALVEQTKLAPKEAEQLLIDANFVWSAYFDTGSIPLWLAQFEVDGEMWKAAVSYNGQLLSLTPFDQDFTCYTTPGENFLATTFPEGEAYVEALDLLYALHDGDLPHEERAAGADSMRPLLQSWIDAHPYYMNAPGLEYTELLGRIYGIPDKTALSEETVLDLAYAAALPQDVQYREARKAVCRYLVTDPSRPVWEVTIGRGNSLPKETKRSVPASMDHFVVTMDAYTGEVLSLKQD